MQGNNNNFKLITTINKILYSFLFVFVLILLFLSYNQIKKYKEYNYNEIVRVGETLEAKLETFFTPVFVCDDIISKNWNPNNNFYLEALKNESLFRSLVGHYRGIDNLYVGDAKGNFAMYQINNDGEVNTQIILRNKGVEKTIWRYYSGNVLIKEVETEGANFDPRNRPWYIKEVKAGLNFIDPYDFFTKGDKGLTLSRQIIQKGKVWGNYGIDITIKDIQAFLYELNKEPNYYIYLATKNNYLIFNDLKDKNYLSNKNLVEISIDNYDYDVINNINDKILLLKKEVLSDVNNPLLSVILIDYSTRFSAIKKSQYIIFLIILIVTFIFFNTIFSHKLSSRARKNLIKIATHDKLTGLKNRHSFEEVFNTYKEKLVDEGAPFSAVICDIDYFKKINDTYGHNNGDLVLKDIAELLKKCARETDSVFRWGGEEFLLLLANANSDRATEISERIRKTIEENYTVTDISKINCTMSFGVCEYTEGLDMKELIKKADDQLYSAKKLGRNRVCYECQIIHE